MAQRRERLRMQLFCFTYAGGMATFFNQLESCYGGKIEFVKLEYPGHGKRRKEPLCQSFAQVADDFYGEIVNTLDGGPYAFLGYSMGSIAAVETLRMVLERKEIAPPAMMFLAAHSPTTMIDLSGLEGNALDEYVKERTIRFGGIPEKLVDNRVLWRTCLPIYKADYSMISNYDFGALRPMPGIPAVVFYSESDTPRGEMEAWQDYFPSGCEFVEYDGNHFFIHDHCEEMAGVIMERLGQKSDI